MLKNDRLLRALRRQPVDRTPVWLMRQAGRYLPEYRATRARAGSFLGMAKNPDIACEVTLQPLERFPLDAAILFSDILTIPDAMGLELYFVEGEGPKFRHPVRDADAIHRLGVPDMETELRYVMDAVRLIRRELDGAVPLIGFSGSPWTLACYMIEGGGSKEYARIKAMAFNAPQLLHHLLSTVTDAVIAYLSAQRAAGAQALQVFDTWGGVLSPAMYREFSLPYLTRIARNWSAAAAKSAPRWCCSARAMAPMCPSWRPAAPKRWVWTGRSRWPTPPSAPAGVSPCRATWTRPRCTARPTQSAAKSARPWTATRTATAARAKATSSTSATACRRT